MFTETIGVRYLSTHPTPPRGRPQCRVFRCEGETLRALCMPGAGLQRTGRLASPSPAWTFSDPGRAAGSAELRQSALERRHRAVDVLQFIEPEQAQPEGAKARRLMALQRHAGRALQAELTEPLAGSDVGVSGIADDHARGLIALGRDARKTRFFQRPPHPLAELLLCFASSLEA